MTETKSLKTKVTLVGDKAVGKTSLIRRYVTDQFDDWYLLTLGTKVSKKTVEVSFPERDLVAHLEMNIWDIMGQAGFREVTKGAYFYGARGILAVVDITRRDTLENLGDWIAAVEEVAGPVPAVLAVNKSDLVGPHAFGPSDVEAVASDLKCEYVLTSAKTGENVEESFRRLATRVVQKHLNL